MTVQRKLRLHRSLSGESALRVTSLINSNPLIKNSTHILEQTEQNGAVCVCHESEQQQERNTQVLHTVYVLVYSICNTTLLAERRHTHTHAFTCNTASYYYTVQSLGFGIGCRIREPVKIGDR